MTQIPDMEMNRLCAEAMGWHTGKQASKVVAYKVNNCAIIAGNDAGGESVYDPLHDDAQAMALVKKLRLRVAYNIFAGCWVASTLPDNETGDKEARFDENLNAAIVKCAAQFQKLHDAAPMRTLDRE